MENKDKQKSASRMLGLSPDASRTEVRRAFCKLAMECHPDVNGGDPAKTHRFKILGEAYRTLMANFNPGNSTGPRRYISPSSGKGIKSSCRKSDLYFRLHLDSKFAAAGGEVSFRFHRKLAADSGSPTERVILRVNIPAGLKNGDRIRLIGQGEPSPHSRSAGDLHVTILISNGNPNRRESQ